MSETKAPTADPQQEAGTQPADKLKENSAGDESKRSSADAEYSAEDTGRSRQRFFSQTEVNRIVKREIERALKSSKLPELEAAQAKVAELETQVKRKMLREQLTDAAAKAGAKNPGLLFHAVEEKCELDESGKVKDLEEILKHARRDYPELFGPASKGNANGGAGQQNNSKLSMNELLRRRGRD